MGWIWHLCLMNMKRRKIRTFLTVLGVMIGVISVVALLAVGIGVKNEMIDSAVASGSVNQITIYSETGSKHKDRMITDRTISTLTDLANVDGCYPLYEVPVSMKYGEYEYFGNLVGVPGNELDGWSLAYGENSNYSHGTPELISGSSVGKMFFNQKTFDSYEKREKKSIASLVGKRFDTTVGWSGESDRIFKLKLAGVLSDGDTDNSSDNASADTSYDSAVQDEESDESLDISDSYSEKSQTIYCDMDSLKSLLRKVSADGKLYGQPVDGNGNSYHEFVYTSAVVIVDDINNVDAMVKKLQDMGVSDREFQGISGHDTEVPQDDTASSRRKRNDSTYCSCHRNKQHHDDLCIRPGKRDRYIEGPRLRHRRAQTSVPHGGRSDRTCRRRPRSIILLRSENSGE